jgi:putative ABC transport system permease protein
MYLREGARLAIEQIRQEKLKSAFSLLGVIIGVMFLVMVVSVVEGMDRYITEDLASEVFGINTIQLRRTPSVQISTTSAQWREWSRRPAITLYDAEALRDVFSVPFRIGTEIMGGGSGVVRSWTGVVAPIVQISTMSSEIFEIRSLVVEEGRPFSPQESDRGIPVVVLGRSVANALFPDSDPIEQRVRIRGFPFRVVGVLEPQGSLFGQSLDSRALIPPRTPIARLMGTPNNVENVVIQAIRPEDLPTALMEAEGAMRVERRLRPGEENNFQLDTAEQSLAFWDQISRVLFIALPGLVGISLVVGGIVIMNIMLVSVMERTREIGVRMAVGATRKDIVSQFLVEAATLSGVGAVIGVAIGVGLAGAIRTLSPLPAAIAPLWIALAIFLGVSVGLIAGVYPAVRASRMDPVAALRYE